MDSQGTIGGLIPLWILGAPFLAGVYTLFTTPRPAHRPLRDDSRTAYAPPPTASSAPGMR